MRLSRVLEVDRWSLLALLRFALALIVATDHLGEHRLLGRLGAFEAVLGFLVISGFSVTHSLRQRPDGFLRRRLLRVMPVYLACLALALLVAAFIDQKPLPGVVEILANALMLNQLATTSSIVGPAWSLSLECWFYALLSLLMMRSARHVRALAWVSFAAFVAFTAARSLLQWPYYAGLGFGANAVLLAFAWFNGSLLARPDADRSTALRDLRWMFAGHIVLDAAIQFVHRLKHHEAARFAVDDLPGFCLQALTLWIVARCLASASEPATAPRPRVRWMTTLGDWSYPLYLVHLPVYAIVERLGGAPPPIAFGVALASAVALHNVVERRWRRVTPASAIDALASRS